jgi:hypothetical protein
MVIRVLAGVTVHVNETDDGYLVGQIHDLPDDKADAIETIQSFVGMFVPIAPFCLRKGSSLIAPGKNGPGE